MATFDYSDMVDCPAGDLHAALGDALVEPARLPDLVEALHHRLVATLRLASRDDILEDAKVVFDALDSEGGRRLAEEQPRLAAMLESIGETLLVAGTSVATHAIPAVMAAHPKYGRPFLELVVRHDGLPRKEIRERLGIADAQLSRMIADFEAVDLVRRQPRGREIFVEPGGAAAAYLGLPESVGEPVAALSLVVGDPAGDWAAAAPPPPVTSVVGAAPRGRAKSAAKSRRSGRAVAIAQRAPKDVG